MKEKLQRLCFILSKGSNEIQALVCSILFYILNDERDTKLSRDAVNLLVESGVCERVIELLSNSNCEVQMQASKLLSLELCHALWLDGMEPAEQVTIDIDHVAEEEKLYDDVDIHCERE